MASILWTLACAILEFVNIRGLTDGSIDIDQRLVAFAPGNDIADPGDGDQVLDVKSTGFDFLPK